LQKITTVLGLFYLFGSLVLVLMGARQNPLPYLRKNKIGITRKVPVTDQQPIAAQDGDVSSEEIVPGDAA